MITPRALDRLRGTIWWDFDGTLVSRPRMWSEAGHRLVSMHRPDLDVPFDRLRATLQTGFPWHHPEWTHDELCSPDDWWNAVYDRYTQAYLDLGWEAIDRGLLTAIRDHITDAAGYQVFEDVRPVLQRLTAQGWRHVIVSNHVPELEQIVADLGLREWFDAVVTSALVGCEKPHPRLFEAARAVTTAARRIVMVGDNPIADCFGAGAAGIPAVLVRKGRGFEPQVRDLFELESLLNGEEFWTAQRRQPLLAVILDMDGLMLDTERLARMAWQQAARELGCELSDTQYLQLIGRRNDECERELCHWFGTGFDIGRFRARAAGLWQQLTVDTVPVKEGLFELLDWIEAAGIQVAIATSTDAANAARSLSKAGLADRIGCIVSGDQVRRSKPSPDIYYEAARRLLAAELAGDQVGRYRAAGTQRNVHTPRRLLHARKVHACSAGCHRHLALDRQPGRTGAGCDPFCSRRGLHRKSGVKRSGAVPEVL